MRCFNACSLGVIYCTLTLVLLNEITFPSFGLVRSRIGCSLGLVNSFAYYLGYDYNPEGKQTYYNWGLMAIMEDLPFLGCLNVAFLGDLVGLGYLVDLNVAYLGCLVDLDVAFLGYLVGLDVAYLDYLVTFPNIYCLKEAYHTLPDFSSHNSSYFKVV